MVRKRERKSEWIWILNCGVFVWGHPQPTEGNPAHHSPSLFSAPIWLILDNDFLSRTGNESLNGDHVTKKY